MSKVEHPKQEWKAPGRSDPKCECVIGVCMNKVSRLGSLEDLSTSMRMRSAMGHHVFRENSFRRQNGDSNVTLGAFD